MALVFKEFSSHVTAFSLPVNRYFSTHATALALSLYRKLSSNALLVLFIMLLHTHKASFIKSVIALSGGCGAGQ